MMSVVTESKKSLSWDTTIRVFFQRIRYSSSQIAARRSRWFVGSSSISSVGWMKRALAREILILQPPLKVFVALPCMAGVKPKPWRILDARASAEAAPIVFSLSYTSFSLDATLASSSSPLSSVDRFSIFAVSSCSSALRLVSSTSAMTTDSSAVFLSPTTSCSTRRASMPSGTGICLFPRSRSRVDFPFPLGPTRPYFLPWAMVTAVFSSRILPLALTVRLLTLISFTEAKTSSEYCGAS
mmetsp:Transcript_9991/g.30432  ORF Transcript_9991/g.30432 Transcript_9991/m.30432 type:complete len:241 (+) Transcript_9991:430-1152(+)